ncbi:hypothetical protein [Nostoc linckia]|uniref:hypothetical protein n=1 Tax=Nostoc linckia TaxID=92942 RepID=UPI0015D4A378|nr:hypothetical protein [Nostoc linckia]
MTKETKAERKMFFTGFTIVSIGAFCFDMGLIGMCAIASFAGVLLMYLSFHKISR